MHAKQRWHVNLFARAKRRSVARRPRQVVGLLVAGAMVIAVASEICWAEREAKIWARDLGTPKNFFSAIT